MLEPNLDLKSNHGSEACVRRLGPRSTAKAAKVHNFGFGDTVTPLSLPSGIFCSCFAGQEVAHDQRAAQFRDPRLLIRDTRAWPLLG